jgi:hypothetical protein
MEQLALSATPQEGHLDKVEASSSEGSGEDKAPLDQEVSGIEGDSRQSGSKRLNFRLDFRSTEGDFEKLDARKWDNLSLGLR